jgi:hypothetical protein
MRRIFSRHSFTRRFDDQLAGAKKIQLKRGNPLWLLPAGFSFVRRITHGVPRLMDHVEPEDE